MWNKFINWIRKLFGIKKPIIDFEFVLDATGGPAKIPQGYYTSFSGVDVKVYFENENGSFLCTPEIRAVSCLDNPEDQVRGEIITLVFDKAVLKALPFKPKNMLMVACNEYGTLCYSKFYDIELGTTKWDISVDDLVREIRTEFAAKSCTHWKNVSDLRRYEDWPESLPIQIQEKLRTYI